MKKKDEEEEDKPVFGVCGCVNFQQKTFYCVIHYSYSWQRATPPRALEHISRCIMLLARASANDQDIQATNGSLP